MSLKTSQEAPPAAAAGRRARRAEARRLEILRAASRTFRTRGFAASGMREIAADADLSPGNLYHYFHGKNEILYFCQDRSLDLLMTRLTPAPPARACRGEAVRRPSAHIRCLLDDLEGSAAHSRSNPPGNLRGMIVAKTIRAKRICSFSRRVGGALRSRPQIPAADECGDAGGG
jgi:AcrR family transcriptional regulator